MKKTITAFVVMFTSCSVLFAGVDINRKWLKETEKNLKAWKQIIPSGSTLWTISNWPAVKKELMSAVNSKDQSISADAELVLALGLKEFESNYGDSMKIFEKYYNMKQPIPVYVSPLLWMQNPYDMIWQQYINDLETKSKTGDETDQAATAVYINNLVKTPNLAADIAALGIAQIYCAQNHFGRAEAFLEKYIDTKSDYFISVKHADFDASKGIDGAKIFAMTRVVDQAYWMLANLYKNDKDIDKGIRLIKDYHLYFNSKFKYYNPMFCQLMAEFYLLKNNPGDRPIAEDYFYKAIDGIYMQKWNELRLLAPQIHSVDQLSSGVGKEFVDHWQNDVNQVIKRASDFGIKLYFDMNDELQRLSQDYPDR